MQHHVGTVAHQRVDLTPGFGELDPQRRVDFVAHARVAVFQVIGVDPLATPGPLQVTGQAACRGHDHRVVGQAVVEHAQHLALGQA